MKLPVLLAAAALGTLGFFRAFQLWRDGLGQGLPVMELLAAVLCIPSAAALMILGRGHYRGGLPACYPGLTTLPGYAALPWLVTVLCAAAYAASWCIARKIYCKKEL